MTPYKFSPPRGLRADSAYSYATIEKLARLIRKVLAPEVANDQALPGVRLFERIDEYAVTVGGQEIQLDYKVEALNPGVMAKTGYDLGKKRIVVVLSPQTYDDLESGEGRARHTVQHELGHAVLHSAQLVRMAAIPHDQFMLARRAALPEHPHYEDTEWQADAFAAALSMPAAGLEQLRLRGSLSVPAMRSAFQVSAQAAEIRLRKFTERRADLLSA